VGGKAEIVVPRSRQLVLATPRGARLLAAVCLALWSADALAQTASQPFPDPLAPNLQTDPRHDARYVERLAEFAHGADVLITDTTYRDHEYPSTGRGITHEVCFRFPLLLTSYFSGKCTAFSQDGQPPITNAPNHRNDQGRR